MSGPEPQEEVRYSVVLYGGVSLAIYISGVCIELLDLVRATADPPVGPDPTAGPDPATPTRVHGAAATVYQAAVGLTSADFTPPPGDDPGNPPAGGASLDDDVESYWEELGQLKGEALLDALLARGRRRKVVVDVLSGSSAGGLNALYLSKALINDVSMAPIRRVWVEQADLGQLLNDHRLGRTAAPASRPHPLRVGPTDFPRSALSGNWFYAALHQALADMDREGAQPLVEALDTYLTTTDLRGIREDVRLSDGKTVPELVNRAVGHLVFGRRSSTGGDVNDFAAENNPFLAFLGRATAAHPAAFEPAQLRATVEFLARGGAPDALDPADPRWSRILKRPGSPDLGPGRWYSDGGAMDNKPFGYALEPVGRRRADQPVDRKVLYVEPSPGRLGDRWQSEQPPGVAEYVFGAFNLGRSEPIRQDVDDIEARNDRIQAVRSTIVDAIESIRTIPGAPWPEADPSLSATELRQRRQSANVRWAGGDDVNSSYERRRFERVMGELAELTVKLAAVPRQSLAGELIAQAAVGYLRRLDHQTGALDNHRQFLVDFDLSYRLRRLSLIDQILSDAQRLALLQSSGRQPPADNLALCLLAPHREADISGLGSDIRRCRMALNDRFLRIRALGRLLQDPTRAEQRSVLADDQGSSLTVTQVVGSTDFTQLVATALARQSVVAGGLPEPDVEAGLGPLFQALKDLGDDLLLQTSTESRRAIAALPEPLGGQVRLCWDHYDQMDRVLLNSWSDIEGELDPVEVVRISPDDAQSIVSPVSQRVKLGGDAVHHFGGFFDQRWRSLDLFWGRLDAAEILIGNLVPAPPDELLQQSGTTAPAWVLARNRVRNELIRLAHLAIISDEGEAVGHLAALARHGHKPIRALTADDPEAVLAYLSHHFDIDHTLRHDQDRAAGKQDLVRRLPKVVGQTLATQWLADEGPSARKRSLALGRTMQGVVELALPSTRAARLLQLLLVELAGFSALTFLASLVVASARAPSTADRFALGGLGALVFGTIVIARWGRRWPASTAGIALLVLSVASTAYGLTMLADGDQTTAIVAAQLVGAVAATALIAFSGTVPNDSVAAWIGVGLLGATGVVAAVAGWRSWPLMLLVVGSALFAAVTFALLWVLGRLGSAITEFGEPRPRSPATN